MRLGAVIVLAAGALFALPACAGEKSVVVDRAADGASVSTSASAGEFAREGTRLVVHYKRPDGVYDGWNIWVWAPGAEGRQIDFQGPAGEFGRVAIIEFDRELDRVGFLVRRGEWQEKDVDQDRYAEIDADGQREIFLVAGDTTIYTDGEELDLDVKITAAFLDAPDRITVSTTAALEHDAQQGVRVTRAGEDLEVRSVEPSMRRAAGRVVYDVTLAGPVPGDAMTELEVEAPGLQARRVFARGAIESLPTPTDVEFGASYAPDATTFRVWSPLSDRAEVLVFDERGSETPSRVIDMTDAGRGVWEARVEGDLHGVQYQYRFESYGKERIVADINARAATADSLRAVVVDLSRTNPAGWDTHTPPSIEHQTDEIIYEIHVRDLTVRDATCPPEHRGTYLGLIHQNPAGAGSISSVSSGIDHLKDLGVTSVHLLPIQDFTAPIGQYNWGYWTALFNVPEGNYSTDPHDSIGTITELKTAIMGLQQAGIRVILDVVYNHTSTSFEGSPFDQTVPWYYFRTTPDGRLRNDAGVGNSVADERAMARDYILDSLEYWVREYKIDGFRFDLLGTHTPETVDEICERLLAIRPDLTLYGEPWTGGGPIQFGKGEQRGTAMGVFNDHVRNAIRGDLDGTAQGFANGPGGDIDTILTGVAGAIDDFADEPTEVVTYVSAHDNLTLWDKLIKSNPDASDALKRRMHKLSLGIVLTSQGAAFLHGGSDFCRTKNGNHNSYDAGDEDNKFDWDRKGEYIEVYEYTRGLIELRKAHPALRMHTRAQIRDNWHVLSDEGVAAFTINGAKVGDDWSDVLVAYNGEPDAQSLDLPAGKWVQVVDEDGAGVEPIRTVRDRLELPGYSMAVLHRED